MKFASPRQCRCAGGFMGRPIRVGVTTRCCFVTPDGNLINFFTPLPR